MPIAPKEIELSNDVRIGGLNPFFLIAGPCVIENDEHAFNLAAKIQAVAIKANLPFIFKASFDKANRSSLRSYRGPGLELGLTILNHIKKDLHLPVISDIHEPWQAEKAAEVLDIIQIPAFLCRQTDLILAAARTGKPLNIKKGQFLAPEDMRNIVDKALSLNNEDLILTERGTCFGYHNLVFDPRSIPIMKEWGFPVVIDASHSVQLPGGHETASGGEARFIPHIARAGISVGADGVFLEVHDTPENALSDKDNSLLLNDLEPLCLSLQRLRNAVIRKNHSA